MGRTPAHDGFECRLMRAENAEKTTGWLENGISAGSDVWTGREATTDWTTRDRLADGGYFQGYIWSLNKWSLACLKSLAVNDRSCVTGQLAPGYTIYSADKFLRNKWCKRYFQGIFDTNSVYKLEWFPALVYPYVRQKSVCGSTNHVINAQNLQLL